MTEDLALLLIGSLVATRLVALLLRGARAELAPYLGLLAVDLAALGIARARGDEGGVLGFAGDGAGLILVLAPGILDSLEARAERRGHARRALWIARLREVLVPGRGSSHHRRVLEQRAAASTGDAATLIAELADEIARAEDPTRAGELTVELVRLQLAAGCPQEAIERAKTLGHEAYERSPALTAGVGAALAELGRLREAIALLAMLETQVVGSDPSAQPLLLAARLSFIAGAGLREELERLLAQRAIRTTLPASLPDHLRALAAASTVDDPEAKAVALDLAQRLLEAGERTAVPIARRAPLTLALIAVNVAALIAVSVLRLGSDELGLARAGALFRPAVLAGEWWRLVSAMFLHAGPFHLVANMYGLYLLGRATEDLLSWPRLLLIYALSGLGGALASLWADRGLSVGASGAIMGVLAALTVVVFARRHSFHPAARRMLLGNLVFLGVLQVFLGWQVPMIDSACHAGGFVAGLLATAGLSPGRSLSPGESRVLRVIAMLVIGVYCAAGFLAVRTPLDRTLARLPLVPMVTGDVRVMVPASWHKEPSGLLVDPHLGIELHIERSGGVVRLGSPQAEDPRVRPLLERIKDSARPIADPLPSPPIGQ